MRVRESKKKKKKIEKAQQQEQKIARLLPFQIPMRIEDEIERRERASEKERELYLMKNVNVRHVNMVMQYGKKNNSHPLNLDGGGGGNKVEVSLQEFLSAWTPTSSWSGRP